MYCKRMAATFSTKHCLTRRAQIKKYVKMIRKSSGTGGVWIPNTIAHNCFKCPQGAEVARHGGDDTDVEKLKAEARL